jgi:hypothetical protein
VEEKMIRLARVLGMVLMTAASAVGTAMADTLPVAADAHINSLQPTATDGAGAVLRVRQGFSRGESRALALFDLAALPAIPPGSSIEKAILRLWVGAISGTGTLSVAAVLEPWDEATVTFADAPALESFTTVPVGPSHAQHYVSVDITELVRRWVSGALDNHGLAVAVAEDGRVDLLIDSKENPATSHPMEIEVAITSVGPQGPGGLPGPPGLGGYTQVSSDVDLLPGFTGNIVRGCLGGRKVLSGGIDIIGDTAPSDRSRVFLHATAPLGETLWVVKITNTSTVVIPLRFWLVCAFTN